MHLERTNVNWQGFTFILPPGSWTESRLQNIDKKSFYLSYLFITNPIININIIIVISSNNSVNTMGAAVLFTNECR